MNVAVMVNLRARRGSHRVLTALHDAMPDARVSSSSTLGEAERFADRLRRDPPDLLVSAGGDGTAVALLTALSPARPSLALVPLGTGNGWANATGAPPWRAAVARLGRLVGGDDPLPMHRFDLIDVCGQVAPFAGTGWDAELLDDYHAIKTSRVLPRFVREGLPGYLLGLGARTIPRQLLSREPVEVEVTNLGADALAVDDAGQVVPVPGGGHGAVLYRGPMSVCGCGTTTELGFGFRALPFAGLVPGRFCTRVYAASPLQAIARLPSLWRGRHPLPHNHTWLLTGCRMRFSRPVPVQTGGDRLGYKTEVEYHLARVPVNVLDWRATSNSPRKAA